MRHEACNGLYKLSLSGLEGGDSINRSFLLLAASTLLKFLPDAQALKPLRVSPHAHSHSRRAGAPGRQGALSGPVSLLSCFLAVCVCRWRSVKRSLC